MPYEIIKKPSGKFQVINRLTGEIHAKGTTLKKAKAQVRLLESLEGGGNPFSRPPRVAPSDRMRQSAITENEKATRRIRELQQQNIDSFNYPNSSIENRARNTAEIARLKLLIRANKNILESLEGGDRTPRFPRDANDRERDLFAYDPPLVDMAEVEEEQLELQQQLLEQQQQAQLRRQEVQNAFTSIIEGVFQFLPMSGIRTVEDFRRRVISITDNWYNNILNPQYRDYFSREDAIAEIERVIREDPRLMNHIRARFQAQFDPNYRGQGRHRRSARPDEEYSSSEEDEEEQEGGASPVFLFIERVLNRPITTPEQAQNAYDTIDDIVYDNIVGEVDRPDDANIRQQLIAIRDYLNRDPRYSNILLLTGNIYSDDEFSFTSDPSGDPPPSEVSDITGRGIQPINHKSDYHYCCGGGFVRPINAKMLPFF
nr:MAG: hypothetical protein [Lake Baikal virophage 8]